ncbi:hypothetical protein OG2516_07405 [Oceanicola granulosus HTCC2516]|uniref:Cell wall hydrolase SleB domain-containing protein n=2 Tax=Oceanicola granulosus TaxID=252302 RepID=Q2CBF3_OCEGH|nr:hypothetical protein OG2516_07405 [Oceanicola granulosus HTCC2516]
MLRAAAVAVGLISISATVTQADALTETRLQALLGEQPATVGMVPSVDLAAQALPPSPEERGIEVDAALTATVSSRSVDALPVASGGAEWECLAEALYFEARGEGEQGLFAVGEVILNRAEDPRYPDTVCEVVNQGTGRRYACQFSYTCDGIPEHISEPAAWRKVGKIAKLLLDGAPRDLTDGSTHYHTTAVNPSWASQLDATTQIGVHRFYRWPLRTASN